MNADYSDEIDSAEAVALAADELESIAEGLLFASPGWAHDVGNSLQAAGLNLEVLKLQCGQGPRDERTGGALHSLQVQLDRIRQLVSLWVQFSVPEAVEASPFDWHGLLDDLAVLMSVTLRHRGCSAEVRCPDVGLLVNGDRFAFLHACLALARAALDHLPTGGHLLFRAEPVTDCLLRCWVGHDTDAATVDPREDRVPIKLLAAAQAADCAGAVGFARRIIERDGGTLWSVGSAARPDAFCFELPLVGGGIAPDSQASA